MNPLCRFIVPEPDEHSGHRRLQWFVSSKETVTGIPVITGRRVMEAAAYERAMLAAFTGLTNNRVMCYLSGLKF